MIPASGPGRSRRGHPLILVAVAAVALAAGAGIAALATAGTSSSLASSSGNLSGQPTASPSASPSFSRPGFGGGRGGFGGGFGVAAGALHGVFVVPGSSGGYQTEDTQRGSVTAVSGSSITVKSADGFTKTYKVTTSTQVDEQSDGIGSVKVGHQVSVLATVSGAAATATSIQDLSLSQAGGFPPGGNSSGSTPG